MAHKIAQISLSALTAIALSMLAATSAIAADVAGKWHGKLDSETVITIDKAGPDYSASLDYPDTTKSVLLGFRHASQSTHKELVLFEVVGNAIKFTIRNTISVNGDTNNAIGAKRTLAE